MANLTDLFQIYPKGQMKFLQLLHPKLKMIDFVQFSQSVCWLIGTWIISGLSELLPQVIYTPVRRLGFYKAFYVQINLLQGTKPSNCISSWSESLGHWGERWWRLGGRFCSYRHHWGEKSAESCNTIIQCLHMCPFATWHQTTTKFHKTKLEWILHTSSIWKLT